VLTIFSAALLILGILYTATKLKATKG